MFVKPTAVSIRTVAELAGVSIATVSNVLNNRTHVSADLARRVRLAVEDLGYVADNAASRLRSKRQAIAGVLVPDLKNSMFATFVSTLEELARRDGFDLLVASCRNDPLEEAARLHAMGSWRPAGCIVISVDGGLGQRRPKGIDLPIIAADRIPDDPSLDLVAVDNAASAERMMRHLAERGFSRCLVAASDLTISNVRERWEGAQTGAALGTVLDIVELGLDPSGIHDGLVEYLAHAALPEVIFCLDHATTLAAFQLLRGLPMGEPPIILASFDDAEWMQLVTPAITAIAQPIHALASEAWGQLMRRVSGDRSAPTTIRLACTIALRGSTVRNGAQPPSFNPDRSVEMPLAV